MLLLLRGLGLSLRLLGSLLGGGLLLLLLLQLLMIMRLSLLALQLLAMRREFLFEFLLLVQLLLACGAVVDGREDGGSSGGRIVIRQMALRRVRVRVDGRVNAVRAVRRRARCACHR